MILSICEAVREGTVRADGSEHEENRTWIQVCERTSLPLLTKNEIVEMKWWQFPVSVFGSTAWSESIDYMHNGFTFKVKDGRKTDHPMEFSLEWTAPESNGWDSMMPVVTFGTEKPKIDWSASKAEVVRREQPEGTR